MNKDSKHQQLPDEEFDRLARQSAAGTPPPPGGMHARIMERVAREGVARQRRRWLAAGLGAAAGFALLAVLAVSNRPGMGPGGGGKPVPQVASATPPPLVPATLPTPRVDGLARTRETIDGARRELLSTARLLANDVRSLGGAVATVTPEPETPGGGA